MSGSARFFLAPEDTVAAYSDPIYLQVFGSRFPAILAKIFPESILNDKREDSKPRRAS